LWDKYTEYFHEYEDEYDDSYDHFTGNFKISSDESKEAAENLLSSANDNIQLETEIDNGQEQQETQHIEKERTSLDSEKSLGISLNSKQHETHGIPNRSGDFSTRNRSERTRTRDNQSFQSKTHYRKEKNLQKHKIPF